MDKKNSLINLGCRLNIYEGEIIKNHLNNNNIKNITVINSCAVTADAERKVAYEIRKAKRTNPENKIIQVEHLSCRPCHRYGKSKCPEGHFNCMNLIDTDLFVE